MKPRSLIPLTLILLVGLAWMSQAQVIIERGTALVAVVDGALTTPSVTFINERTSGLHRAGAGDVRLQVLGTNRFEATPLATHLMSPDGGRYLVVFNGQVFVNSATLALGTGGVPDILYSRIGAGILSLSDADMTPEIRWNVSGVPSLGTCGDGALATGSSNTSGRVTGTTQTACTLTFSTSFLGNSTDCFIENLTANRGNVTAASSTAFTASNLTAGDDFSYLCVGR